MFHNKRHPLQMGAPEVSAFLTHLAVDGHVAASTQNQAISALLFLYREVLEQDFVWLDNVVRAKKPKRLPVVFTPEEAMAVIGQLQGVRWLMGLQLYGGGLRLMECLRLRVKDLDLERLQVTVREGSATPEKPTIDRAAVQWAEAFVTHQTRRMLYMASSALTGGQALASVTNYYLQGKSPGSSVTVYDSQGNYPRALAGAKGKARWNDRQRRYEIVECNQMAIALACTLAYDMCSGTATGTIGGHTVLTFPPYGQAPNPLPATARNYYHLAGRGGDWCLVLWDEDIDDWAIAQVAHHEIEVPIRYRYYDGYLQAKHRKIAVMYCEDETDWRNEIKLEEAEFVDGVRFTGCENASGGGTGGGTGTSPGETGGTGGGTPAAAQSGGSGGGCGSIEYHTVKGYFFEPPKPQAWKNVLTFQEQAVLVAAAGAGSCITFQEVTVCTPCVGPGDTSQVCANVETKVDCVCSCSCNCNCGDSGGGGYPSSGGDSGGGGSGSCSCSCTCTCKAKSVITFG